MVTSQMKSSTRICSRMGRHYVGRRALGSLLDGVRSYEDSILVC